MEHQQSCEYCKVQIHCRNLYVAMRILEEELRFTNRDDLWREFNGLKKEMADSGFNYPHGNPHCTLSDSSINAQSLVARAEALLRELRRTVSISPA
jgi:hypothetical protein